MRKRGTRHVGFAGGVVALAVVTVAVAGEAQLPPVAHPVENPPSEAKRVLGKILFFEEQLSADNTVACATCHVMARGGTDPRRRRNPGSNMAFGDAGDVFASPGVLPMAADGRIAPGSVFGVKRQVTGRTTPSPFAATYAPAILWDGKAGDRFVDPVTQATVIESGGALESQALLPLTHPAEMGHADRGLPEVLAKIEQAVPLALADRLPPDLATALEGDPGYPELFRRAFGDTAVTAPRVAMAIATFERTLLPNRTDYDRFIAGDTTALTAQEQRGLDAFRESKCAECHVPPLFTDNTFRATGVRPHREDAGRGGLTMSREDNGRFRVPSLRNVALKRSFFHDGKRTTLHDAIKFYARIKGPARPTFERRGGFVSSDRTAGYGRGDNPDEVQFIDNQDPVMGQIELSEEQIADIEAFLSGGLVDPRVQDEAFPFNRPVLASEHTDLTPELAEAGRPGIGGGVPEIVVTTPAFAGNDDFRVGVSTGPIDATARLISWSDGGGAPTVSETVTLTRGDTGNSTATIFHPLTDVEPGTVLHFVWQIDAPNTIGWSLSRTLDVPVFAPRAQAVAEAGASREPVDPAAVDDRDAYVVRAAFRLDRAAHRRDVNRDEFSATARINPRGVGADLSQGRLTVWVGGTAMIQDVALDAAGRMQSQNAEASFDPATGSFAVSLRALDLRTTFADASSGRRGRTIAPVIVTIQGLGLANPTASADVPFSWREKAGGVAAGAFDFARSGTDRGSFQITRILNLPVPGGAGVHLVAKGILDGPGGERFSAPNGLVIRVGTSFKLEVAANQIVTSKKDGTITVWGPQGRRALTIDTKRRSINLELVVDDPALSDAPSGTIVPLRIRLDTRASESETTGTYETVADVVIR